jgi:hypothetical protein
MELAGIPERIAAKIELCEETGCMLWRGYADAAGYGQVSVDGRIRVIHRYMYEMVVGPIPPKYHVDHRLANRETNPGPCIHGPRCCNPDHLQAVPLEVNLSLVRNWNRRKMHCPRGHEYAVHGYERQCADGRTRRYCKLCEGGKSRKLKMNA